VALDLERPRTFGINMDSLLLKISQLYGLNLTLVEKVRKGFLSENYVLTDGSRRYFLKKYLYTREGKIKEIHQAKKFFAEGQIPVILPFIAEDDASFFNLRGRFYALFPFVEGKEYLRGTLTQKATESLGAMLGRIHSRGKESHIAAEKTFKPWNKGETLQQLEQIFERIQSVKNQSDFDQLALDSLNMKRNVIESNQIIYNSQSLPSDHLIHGDYMAENVFFNEKDEVSFVFDWEKIQYAPRTFELFRSLFVTFINEAEGVLDLKKSKQYVDSYRASYSVSPQELQQGFDAAYLRSMLSLWVEGEHYLQNNFRPDSLYPSECKRNRFLYKNLAKVKTMLT
jgi:Ser/Thr protein kinase RdoA (MazF antagonist)